MNKDRKKQRRQEAIERQKARDDRTPLQQIRKLDREGWNATKERKRLEKLLHG